MAEKYTTLFNFEIEGVESVEKGMQEISKILMPTKELGALIGKLGVDLSSFFENVGKGMKLDDAGIDTVFKDISQSIRAMTEDFSFKGITIDTGPISEEIKVLEEKVRQGTERVKELQEKLEKEKQQILSDMATKYGQPIDEAFLDGTKAAAKLNKINADISKNTKDTSKETKEALLEEAENFKNFTKDLKTYFEKRKSLGSQLGGTQKGLGINTVKLEEAKGNKALSEQINTKELEKEEKAVRELADAYNFLIKIMKYLHDLKIEEQNKILAKRTKEQAEAVKLAAKEEDNLEEAMNKGEKTMAKKLATGLSYYTIFNQIKKIVKLSIKTIQDLDAAMTKASIVTEMTRKETWKLLKSYQNLAHETGKTTSEIANLNAFFLQQGKSIKQAMEMTEAAAKSAAVAGTSLQDAANYITSAIHGFGLAADQAEVVADKFAALGAASASSFEEIAIAMSKVAPVAQSAGVGIDFMMGILAKGIHTTREAPEAIGTAMKTIFARMRELTDIGKATEDGMSLNRVEKALNSVNVDLRDVTGQFRNLEDVLIDVGMKWDTLNSMEQAYLATALAGTRQQPRLLAILNDFDTTMDFIKISAEAEDELMYQHMDYMKGMEAASNNLKNSWEQIITSIVNADTIIGVTQALAFILDKIASGVEWITEKTALLISLLTVIIPLAINRVALLIAEYNARRKKNKEVKKGHALEKISLAYSLKTIKASIKMLPGLVAERKKIRQLNKEKEKGNKIKLKSFFASTLEKLGIQGTTGALAVQATVWPLVIWYIMVFIAAIAVLALGIYGIIKLFQSLSKSVDDYAKAIDKSNKKIHESKKKVKAVKDLQEEYDTLNNKVNKTNEDLERMDEILGELSDHDENYSFVVDGEINRKELARYELDEMRKQGKERAKQLKNATASVSKNLAESLEDPSVMKVFQKYGETIVDSLVIGLDEKIAENVKTSLYLQIDTEEIARKFGNLGTRKDAYWRAFSKGYSNAGKINPKVNTDLVNANLVERITAGLNAGNIALQIYDQQEEELHDRIADEIKSILQEYKIAHQGMADIMDDSLLVRLKKFRDISKELNSDLVNSFKAAYPELNALLNAANAFKMELEEIISLVENLDRRGIGSDNFMKKLEKYAFGSIEASIEGKDANFLGQLGHDIAQYYGLNAEIDAIRADLEVAYSRGKEEDIKDLEEKLNTKLQKKINMEAKLPVKTFKNAYISATLFKYQEDLLKLVNGDEENFKADDFVKNISETLYKSLKFDSRVSKEEKIFEEEAFTIARNIALDLTTSAEQVTEKFKKTGQVITDSLKLPQELIQGNFETLDKLAGELGANGLDILEKYFETGDMSGIQKVLNDRLEDEINLRLKVLRTAEKLSQEEKLEIFKLEQQLKYITAFSNEYDIWNEKIKDSNKLLEISKSTLSFLDKLEDLELNIKIEGAEEFANSVRDVALTEIGTNVENATYLKNEAIQKMIDAGLMNQSGKMVASAKTYDQRMALENYYLANEVWEEAINGGVQIVEQELNRLKKEQEKEKKFIEDSHKERMDILKKQYDEKWKAIDYENKLLDLQEKVTEARNKLATAMFSGDASGQKDATKALKEAREARQKEIESQILDKIQKEEEEKKNERLEKIQKNIETYTQDMATALEKLLNSEGGEGLKVKLNNPPELDKTDEDEKDVLKEEVYNASEDREKLITLVGGVKEGVKEIANSLKNKDTSQPPTNTDRGSKPKGGGKPNLDLKAMLG